jgi:hypothetical protein
MFKTYYINETQTKSEYGQVTIRQKYKKVHCPTCGRVSAGSWSGLLAAALLLSDKILTGYHMDKTGGPIYA